MDNLKRETIKDLKEVNFLLWQSLITINSLFATILIAIAAFKESLSTFTNHVLFFGFIASTVSCLLLVINFKKTKNFYTKIAEVVDSGELPSDEETKVFYEKNRKISKEISNFENWAFISSAGVWVTLVLIVKELLR
jgi:hypothetical protein